jgi:hypothetical protein
MVIELIQQLGVQGKEAFLWWLALDKVLPVLGWLLTLVAFGHTAIKIIGMVSGKEGQLRSIRDALGVGCSGQFIDSQYTQVMREIDDLMGK